MVVRVAGEVGCWAHFFRRRRRSFDKRKCRSCRHRDGLLKLRRHSRMNQTDAQANARGTWARANQGAMRQLRLVSTGRMGLSSRLTKPQGSFERKPRRTVRLCAGRTEVLGRS
jgi:hypothetical protein